MGVTGPNTGQFSVPSATLSPEAMALETPHITFGIVAIGPNKSAKFRQLWVTYSER
ncbi:hypothetical protein DPMN_092455 [Dreissena polymorpha]|uniref:Uncharacterized protein n=1 Tax=Dreissena polymorpha TaxID=45954 RepID=A0A9D4R1P6_DREPO|nr:hypothetical protein DPMN_092455 [Dreissena polymorpha]